MHSVALTCTSDVSSASEQKMSLHFWWNTHIIKPILSTALNETPPLFVLYLLLIGSSAIKAVSSITCRVSDVIYTEACVRGVSSNEPQQEVLTKTFQTVCVCSCSSVVPSRLTDCLFSCLILRPPATTGTTLYSCQGAAWHTRGLKGP